MVHLPSPKEARGRAQESTGSNFSGDALPSGDGKERLGVLKSDPSPLDTQSGIRERALA